MNESEILGELVRMSAYLGKPENDYVILGEGNTSAKAGEFFFVKASGRYLADSSAQAFVKVDHKKALDVLDQGDLSDDQIKDALLAACADPSAGVRPSVETTFHAFLLTLLDVNFVGHTHPTAVNSLMCSVNAEKILSGRIFPDEIVYCGVAPMYVPYIDPGLGLAREIRRRTQRFHEDHGVYPKVILIQNHGLIALGKTAHEVEAITAMWCKTCRVLMGACAFGGINYFTRENVDRIFSRPDEHYRKQQLK